MGKGNKDIIHGSVPHRSFTAARHSGVVRRDGEASPRAVRTRLHTAGSAGRRKREHILGLRAFHASWEMALFGSALPSATIVIAAQVRFA
jgi:hypothetical protein